MDRKAGIFATIAVIPVIAWLLAVAYSTTLPTPALFLKLLGLPLLLVLVCAAWRLLYMYGKGKL